MRCSGADALADRHRVAGVPQPGLRPAQGDAEAAGASSTAATSTIRSCWRGSASTTTPSGAAPRPSSTGRPQPRSRRGGPLRCRDADPRHPVRRRRHPPVAAVARAVSQAVAAAGRHAHLLQDTVRRLQGLEVGGPPVVVCNEAHRFLVAEQLRQIGRRAARASCSSRSGATPRPPSRWRRMPRWARMPATPLLLVLPADHVIRDVPAFHAAVQAGRRRRAAPARWSPSASCPTRPRPATATSAAARAAGRRAAASRSFVEKPDHEHGAEHSSPAASTTGTAACSCSARAATSRNWRSTRRTSRPCAAAAAASGQRDLDFTRIDAGVFEACRSESIDYAVMEKTAAARGRAAGCGWSDVGSWAALQTASTPDAQRQRAAGRRGGRGTHGSFVHAESRLVAAVGLDATTSWSRPRMRCWSRRRTACRT